MANSRTALQRPLAFATPPTAAPRLVSVVLEPKGVVYTKAWVVELLLDLAEYRSDKNLVDAVAIGPAAGGGAFLGPMIERLIASCRKLGRPVSDCRGSLVAYELDVASADRARALAVNILTARGVEKSVAETLAASAGRGPAPFAISIACAVACSPSPSRARLAAPGRNCRGFGTNQRSQRATAGVLMEHGMAAMKKALAGPHRIEVNLPSTGYILNPPP